MAEKIECPRCKGTGEYRAYYRVQDDGEITGYEITGELHWIRYNCGFCDGTGEVDPDTAYWCEECDGTGEDSEGYECSACDATGIDEDGPWADEFIEDTGNDEPTYSI